MSTHNGLFRFAIVGYGNIGRRHAEHILRHNEASLTLICDNNPAQYAALLAKRPDIIFCENFSAVLQNENIDIVNICTPNYLHAEMSIAALRAGKHVVCEKPMALSSLDCDAMNEAAVLSGKKLFVVKQNRYNPPVVAVKKLLEDGKLGRVYQVAVNCFWNRNETYYLQSGWHGKKALDGGCLFTQCSHFIDILYYLIGDVYAISGLMANQGHNDTVEFEDSGAFLLKSATGVLVSINFSTCTYQKNMEGSITIIAENGTVKIGGQYLNTIDYQQLLCPPIANLPLGNLPNDYGAYQGSMSNHDKVIQNVIDTLQGRDTIATDGYSGQQVVAIIESMYASVV